MSQEQQWQQSGQQKVLGQQTNWQSQAGQMPFQTQESAAYAQPQSQPAQQPQPQPQPQTHQPQSQYAYAQGAYSYTTPPAYVVPPIQAMPTSGPAPMPAPVPKKRGWIVALVAVILLFVLLFLSLNSCTRILSSQTSSFGSYGSSSSAEIDALTQDAVGVITIDGTIQYDGTTSSPEGLKEQLDIAAENEHIKAVVLRVNSGGGTATAGEEMATYVREFREATSKPVVVSSASINASAAYEISSQANFIYTAKTSAIGSIGTAMQVTDLSGLYDKLGIRIENITSSDGKDSSYGTRSLTEEERAYYQAMVDQINESFIETVAKGRNMEVEAVRELATGLTFTGVDAVNNGLADDLGTLEDAIDKAEELAGAKDCKEVSLEPNSSLSLTDMLGLFSKANSASDLEELVGKLNENESISNE